MRGVLPSARMIQFRDNRQSDHSFLFRRITFLGVLKEGKDEEKQCMDEEEDKEVANDEDV